MTNFNLEEKALGLTTELFNIKKTEIDTEFTLKENMEKLKYEIAGIMGYKDKEGNIDPKMVKNEVLKLAVELTFQIKKNPIEEKYNEYVAYKELIETNDDLKPYVKQLQQNISNIDTLKENFKDIKKNYNIEELEHLEIEKRGSNNKSYIKEIVEIVKEKAKEYKNDLLDKKEKEQNSYQITIFNITEMLKKIVIKKNKNVKS